MGLKTRFRLKCFRLADDFLGWRLFRLADQVEKVVEKIDAKKTVQNRYRIQLCEKPDLGFSRQGPVFDRYILCKNWPQAISYNSVSKMGLIVGRHNQAGRIGSTTFVRKPNLQIGF